MTPIVSITPSHSVEGYYKEEKGLNAGEISESTTEQIFKQGDPAMHIGLMRPVMYCWYN